MIVTSPKRREARRRGTGFGLRRSAALSFYTLGLQTRRNRIPRTKRRNPRL